MLFALVSFIAGVLTVLAPCILPLLPVIIGRGSAARHPLTPYIVIGSLALSIFIFTYLLKASTLLITIHPSVWAYVSGGILVTFGLLMVFPNVFASLPFINKGSQAANRGLGTGYKKKSFWGDILIGASLGPVFSTCSPTYFVILATVLPASFFVGTIYLIIYILGLVSILILITLLGQRFANKLSAFSDNNGYLKRGFGLLFIIIGIGIATGTDKKFETWVLDTGWFDVSRLEQKILDQVTPPEASPLEAAGAPTVQIPRHLQSGFPTTDWQKSDPRVADILSGGPRKDGIPALDTPTFIALRESNYPDDIEAIVLTDGIETRIYPYNILVWHEIVNDTFGGQPVAVTFCPLCGSALVFNRTLPDGTAPSFGVSGSLLESNMVMFDRATESLWQQSTGRSIAGTWHTTTLAHVPFQLLTLADIRQTYPDAQVLSTNTGYARDYERNPYASYETTDRFFFPVSTANTDLPPKTIMVVVPLETTVAIVALNQLREVARAEETINGDTITLTMADNGEISVLVNAEPKPFYFEMLFSVLAHREPTTVYTINP